MTDLAQPRYTKNHLRRCILDGSDGCDRVYLTRVLSQNLASAQSVAWADDERWELAYRLLTPVTEKCGMAVVIMSSMHWIVMRRVQTILGGRLVPCGFPRPMSTVSKGQHVRQAERWDTRISGGGGVTGVDASNVRPNSNTIAFKHFVYIHTHLFPGSGARGLRKTQGVSVAARHL